MRNQVVGYTSVNNAMMVATTARLCGEARAEERDPSAGLQKGIVPDLVYSLLVPAMTTMFLDSFSRFLINLFLSCYSCSVDSIPHQNLRQRSFNSCSRI